jgi:elongation factor G
LSICSTRKAWVWDESGMPENYTVQDVPEDMVAQVEEVAREADRGRPGA